MTGLVKLVLDFNEDVQVLVDKVHKQTFADVLAEANTEKNEGGLMPIDTGDLQDSITVGSDGGLATGKRHYQSAILSASPNSQLFGSWQIEYAGYVEFGTSRQAAQPFLRTAIMNFDNYFRRNVAVL